MTNIVITTIPITSANMKNQPRPLIFGYYSKPLVISIVVITIMSIIGFPSALVTCLLQTSSICESFQKMMIFWQKI